MRLYIILFLLFSLFSINAYGQSASRPTPAPVATTTATPEPERFLNKDLKTQIFEIKHRDPLALVKVLKGLSSDDRGTQLTPDKDFKTITVRDYQENITVMERAISKLDTPEKLPANLEVQLHIIAASRGGKEKGQVPENLKDIVTELQKNINYGNYRYVTSILNRVQDGTSIESRGSTDPFFPMPDLIDKTGYSYLLRNIKLGMDVSGNEVVQINSLSFDVRSPVAIVRKDGTIGLDYKDASISTSLSLREGEKVVVGSANIGSSDDALILVISVKKVK